MSLDAALRARARELFDRVAGRLLAERAPSGRWVGELSTSALSTATASFALLTIDRARGTERHRELVERGLDWLARHANEDGGWGDTTRSRSNLSTTLLAWSALGATSGSRVLHARVLDRARAWIESRTGSVEPERIASALADVYGEDRTFSVPILTLAALAGRLGPEPACWRLVAPLPFELASLPRQLFRHVGLPVVSYALPALIAIGQARHVRAPGAWPVRSWREAARARTLRVLDEIQPSNGGFLEATPLTSFVAMSLAAADAVGHVVVERAETFLVDSMRADGSWPIDTNLSTWLTTSSIQALDASGRLDEFLSPAERAALRDSLLAEQTRETHSYTGAAPGAWAWTELPGGVPDADDTAGALLALGALDPEGERSLAAAGRGVRWLLDLQNRDGGIPTFCRGWGKLPFDRSGTDLTAHALRAFEVWYPATQDLSRIVRRAPRALRLSRARDRALAFLLRTQRPDGAWTPLWFGNEHEPREENPLYGTARVLLALAGAPAGSRRRAAAGRARQWLLRAQADDGGWGGAGGLPSSVEETALAIGALAAFPADSALEVAIGRGVESLERSLEAGEFERPTPIGFYFASLWYHERLYPFVHATEALGRVARLKPGDGPSS